MTQTQLIEVSQRLQTIADKNAIADLKVELFKSDMSDSLKIEIDLWLQRAYARLQPIKTSQ